MSVSRLSETQVFFHTTEAIAWPAVRPIPTKLLPIVHDDRQMPHVPESLSRQ